MNVEEEVDHGEWTVNDNGVVATAIHLTNSLLFFHLFSSLASFSLAWFPDPVRTEQNSGTGIAGIDTRGLVAELQVSICNGN